MDTDDLRSYGRLIISIIFVIIIPNMSHGKFENLN